MRDRGLPDRVLAELAERGLSYEADGALWFRSTQVGDEATDDKDRVLRRSNGEVTYFAVDVAYHHYVKFGAADRLINSARSRPPRLPSAGCGRPCTRSDIRRRPSRCSSSSW